MQEDELEKKASFDPRIGFTIRNLTVKDSDWYKCSIEKDDEEHEVNYVLSVHRKCGQLEMLISPHIRRSKATY